MKAKPAASAAEIERPKYPKRVTPESVARYKSALREYDARRLAAGVPAEQIQRENSFFRGPVKGHITGGRTVPAAVLRLLAK